MTDYTKLSTVDDVENMKVQVNKNIHTIEEGLLNLNVINHHIDRAILRLKERKSNLKEQCNKIQLTKKAMIIELQELERLKWKRIKGY